MCRTCLRRRLRGDTPGPHGHRWDTYGYSDGFAKCGEIEFRVRRGEFEHEPTRKKPIEKPAGGMRTLRIPNVEVRLQQRAVLDFLQSGFDNRFAPCNWGFRPGRSRLGAMAEVAERLVNQPELYLLIADVKDAFDSVPIRRLEEKLREWVIDERIVEWASTLSRIAKRKGLGQGGPLSPFLLNVLLHDELDSRELPDSVVRFRYADDLLLLAPSPEALVDSSKLIQQRLQHAGMRLKDADTEPWRAGERPTCWLGFEFLVAEGKLHFTIPEGAWLVLESRLNRARSRRDPGVSVRNLVHGWIPQFASVLSCDSEAECAKLLAPLGAYRVRRRILACRAQEAVEQVSLPLLAAARRGAGPPRPLSCLQMGAGVGFGRSEGPLNTKSGIRRLTRTSAAGGAREIRHPKSTAVKPIDEEEGLQRAPSSKSTHTPSPRTVTLPESTRQLVR